MLLAFSKFALSSHHTACFLPLPPFLNLIWLSRFIHSSINSRFIAEALQKPKKPSSFLVLHVLRAQHSILYILYVYISITSNIYGSGWGSILLIVLTYVSHCVLVDWWWTLFIVVAQLCTFLEINTYVQTSWKSYANWGLKNAVTL